MSREIDRLDQSPTLQPTSFRRRVVLALGGVILVASVSCAPTPTGGDPIAGQQWVGRGIPAPGYVFESMSGDRTLDAIQKSIALTFDDGPSEFTLEIAQLLEDEGVPATFFVVGSEAERSPEIVRKLGEMGFSIGAHTMSHPHLPLDGDSAQVREIRDSADLVDGLVPARPTRCLRPPYGEFDATTIEVARDRGLGVALWTLDTNDWAQPGVQEIVGRVLAGASDRGVVLLHDGGGDRRQTVDALPWIIFWLREAGYTFVDLC